MDKEEEFNLTDIVYLLSKYNRKIIQLAIIGALIGSLIAGAKYYQEKNNQKYIITCSFAVVTTNSSGKYVTNTTTPGYNDIILAEDMAESVIFVTKSDRALSSAIENMHFLGITENDIQDNLTVEQYEDTQIITLKLKWDNVSEGLDIIQAICDVVPDILTDTLNLGSVSVVDYPENEGLEEVRIRVEYPIISALVLSGIYLIFGLLKKVIHPTVTDLTNIESDLGNIECLGYLPDDEKYFTSRPYSLSLEYDIDHYEVKEAIASTAHLLRSVIVNEGHKVLYFTSSESGEGKTGIVANMAIELSKQELKTLVIDMDIRKPTLGSCFINHVEHEHSINGIFDDTVNAKDALVKINEYLDILPGRLEKTRVRIDKALTKNIKGLFDDYDVVLLDAAPVGLVSDITLLNEIANRAIMVVRYDKVWIETIKQNIKKLRILGLETSGTIITNVQNYHGLSYYTKDSYSKYYDISKKKTQNHEKTKKGFFKRLKKEKNN